MSIQLIASDMDGTLLDPYTHISPANIDAINRLGNSGVEFIICSGRDYHDAKKMMERYGITCGYICLSGAIICEPDGSILAKISLSQDNLSHISRILDKYHVAMDILTEAGLYSTDPKEAKLLELCTFYNGQKPFSGSIPREIMQAAEKWISNINFIQALSDIPKDVTIYKICSNNIDKELVTQMKSEFLTYPDIAAASSFPTNIELTNTKAQKGNALKTYAARKNISLDDVMVLGDSDNDLSMFAPEFGWTIAMENAMPCIRDAAKYHTKSNLEDGVAWAIDTYVFNKHIV